MAAPTFGSAGTYLTASTTTSATIAAPSGLSAGDGVLIVLYKENTAAVTLANTLGSSGFRDSTTLLGTAVVDPGGERDFNLYVYWRRASSSEPTYAFSWTGSAYRLGFAIRYAGVVPSGSFVDDWDSAIRSTNGAITPAVNVTTTGPDRKLVWIGAQWDEGTWTAPSGYTMRTSSWPSQRLLAVADRDQASAGSSGDVTGSSGAPQSTGAPFTQGAFLIALEPEISVATPGEVLGIGQGDGMNHYSVDVAAPTTRELHETSEIAAGYEDDPAFIATSDGERVQFRAGVSWATTSGSDFARSEMRETFPGGDTEFGFDPTVGQHWQRVKTRATHLAMTADGTPRPQVVLAQLHDGSGDAVQVLTQWSNANARVDLLIRANGTGSTIPNPPGQRYINDYQVDTEVEVLLEIREDAAGVQTFYWYFDDLLEPFTSLPVSIFENAGILDTYFFKAGCYNQSNVVDYGEDPAEYFATEARHLQHWHTGWAPPENYVGWPEVDAGSDGEGATGTAFARTADESGSGILERRWHVLDGPSGATEVGTDVGSSAALSWTPSAPGDYLLRYSARNANGWANPSTIAVTVEEGSVTGSLDSALPMAVGSFEASTASVGSLASELGVPRTTLTASAAVTGQLSGLLEPLSAVLSGQVSVPGPIGSALSAPTTALSATSSTVGTLGGQLTTPVIALDGASGMIGVLAATPPSPLGSLAGNVAAYGLIGATLPGVNAAITGGSDAGGLVLSAQLTVPSAGMLGAVSTSGAVRPDMPEMTGSLRGGATTTGSLAAELPLISSSLGGSGGASGALSSYLPTPAAELAADLRDAGVVQATISLPVASLTAGADLAEGPLHVVLGVPTVALHVQVRSAGSLSGALPPPIGSLRDTEPEVHGASLHAGPPTVAIGLLSGPPTVGIGLQAGHPVTSRAARAGQPTTP